MTIIAETAQNMQEKWKWHASAIDQLFKVAQETVGREADTAIEALFGKGEKLENLNHPFWAKDLYARLIKLRPSSPVAVRARTEIVSLAGRLQEKGMAYHADPILREVAKSWPKTEQGQEAKQQLASLARWALSKNKIRLALSIAWFLFNLGVQVHPWLAGNEPPPEE